MLIRLISHFITKTSARFARATGGNIAVIFAIVLVPILGLVGTAVDYSRVAKARSSMQSALDSAALMVSKDVANNSSMTAAQITAKGLAYFNALYGAKSDVSNIVVSTTYSSTGVATVTMNGQATMGTQFLNVIGFPSLTFNSQSKTTWGMSSLRVALSLDVTGSMADNGKIGALRTAATNMVNTLSGLSKTPGDVYISLVPFAKDVNIGTGYASANWIDWTDWDAANTVTTTTTTSQCLVWFIVCLQYKTVTTTSPQSHALWTGCVTDRTQDYDTKNTTPVVSNVQTLFPAEEYQNYCKVGNVPYLMPVMPLTSNWTLLKANIALLTPTGNTNQPIGLAWAWETLTAGDPMQAPAKAVGTTYTDVIVHMSDGMNTQNRWTSTASAIDARQATLCTNIKAAGVRIISMQVNTDGSPTMSVMQNCASSPTDFYLVTSASQLITAFDQITNSLTKLRIAK